MEPVEDHMDPLQQQADMDASEEAAEGEDMESGLAPDIEPDPSIEMSANEESDMLQDQGLDQGDAVSLSEEEMMNKLYDPDDLRSKGFMGKAAALMKQKLRR